MRNMQMAIRQQMAQEINQMKLDLLGVALVKNVDHKTGETSTSVRVDAEIGKGQGIFSRCQFSVKIPDSTKIKVTEEELEAADYEVFFNDLEISYFDGNGNVYFRASSYEVEKEVE